MRRGRKRNSCDVVPTSQPPPEENQNGIITSYNLEYRLILSGLMRRNFMESIPTNGSLQQRVTHVLTDLQPGDTYEATVSAVNSAGPGPSTFPITAVILSGERTRRQTNIQNKHLHRQSHKQNRQVL